MRRYTAVWFLMVGLSVAVGCDKPEAPAVDPADAPAEQPTKPEVVPPLELLPDEQDGPSKPEPSDPEQTEPEQSEAPEPASVIEVDPTIVNAVHATAGRSAFPERDEALEEPIATKRLSDEDPFGAAIDEADIPDIVPWDQAKKYIGYEITVEGKIVNVGQTRDASVNFLNFHKDWRGKFYMVVFDDLAKTLPRSVEQTFRDKTLRVTGVVENHRGRPQIRILSMDQVQFVD